MKSIRKRLGSMIPLVLLLFGPNTAPASQETNVYRLRPGDTVLVSVWREENLQRELRVLPDGSISFPLAGRVELVGLSTQEAEQRIAERLKAFISEPEVTVVVTAAEGHRIYVIGKVANPGPIVLTGPTTALQALSLVGGVDRFADRNAIKVLRNANGKSEILPVRYNDLVEGRNLETNVELMSGDTLLVP